MGELIQHDSSHHRWSPSAKDKWYLVTSIDDYSRFMLYAKLFKKETSWTHMSRQAGASGEKNAIERKMCPFHPAIGGSGTPPKQRSMRAKGKGVMVGI